MENNSQSNKKEEFDIDDLLYFMSLSVEEKLKHLEDLYDFVNFAMPQESKEIWEKLKKMGF